MFNWIVGLVFEKCWECSFWDAHLHLTVLFLSGADVTRSDALTFHLKMVTVLL
jgi:hypothetical protein